jgi:plastocyanin
MTRLAGITTIYAVVATLVLVAPLSAAPEDDPAGGETAPAAEAEAPSEGSAPEEAPAPDSEAAPVEPAPAPAPEPAPAPVPEPAPAPAPEPAAPVDPAAVAQAEVPPEDSAAPKKRKDRPKARAAASTTVTIRDFEYAPPTVTIDVGDTVTWSNDGPTGHTATADGGSFDTGLLADGESGSHTFDQAGSFSYFCEPHPFMKGTVTVQAAAGGGSSEGSGGDTGAGSTGGEPAAGSEDDSGSALPATGLEPGGLAVLGMATLLLGLWLRRRAAADH